MWTFCPRISPVPFLQVGLSLKHYTFAFLQINEMKDVVRLIMKSTPSLMWETGRLAQLGQPVLHVIAKCGHIQTKGSHVADKVIYKGNKYTQKQVSGPWESRNPEKNSLWGVFPMSQALLPILGHSTKVLNRHNQPWRFLWPSELPSNTRNGQYCLTQTAAVFQKRSCLEEL